MQNFHMQRDVILWMFASAAVKIVWGLKTRFFQIQGFSIRSINDIYVQCTVSLSESFFIVDLVKFYSSRCGLIVKLICLKF